MPITPYSSSDLTRSRNNRQIYSGYRINIQANQLGIPAIPTTIKGPSFDIWRSLAEGPVNFTPTELAAILNNNSGSTAVQPVPPASWVWAKQDGGSDPPTLAAWRAVSLSADGNTAAVCGQGTVGPSYTLGAWIGKYSSGSWTWTQQTGPPIDGFWWSISISADGNTAALSAYDGTNGVWIGKYSSGSWTWTQQSGSGKPLLTASWNSISLSGDANTVAVCASSGGGAVWIGKYSSGSWTWTLQDGASDPPIDGIWNSISLSADGNTVALCGYGIVGWSVWIGKYSSGSWIWAEQNGGSAPPTTAEWKSISLSGDGNTAAVCSNNTSIGVWIAKYSTGSWTWTQQTPPISAVWNSISLSLDGNMAALCAYDGINGVWFGKFSSGSWTWTQQTDSGNPPLTGAWFSVSLSADGNTAAVGADFASNGIWIGKY